MNTGFQSFVLTRLLGALGPMLQQILSVLTSAETMGQVALLARDEVAKLEGIPADQMTPQAKHDAAKAAIEMKLKALGVSVAGMLVNVAIEVGLAYVRAQATKAA